MIQTELGWLIDQLAPQAGALHQSLCLAHLYQYALKELQHPDEPAFDQALSAVNQKLATMVRSTATEENPTVGFRVSLAEREYAEFKRDSDDLPRFPARLLAWLMQTTADDNTRHFCRESCQKAGITNELLFEACRDRDAPPVGQWITTEWLTHQIDGRALRGRRSEIHQHLTWLTNALRRKQHYLLDGWQGVGKSFFLLHLLRSSFTRWKATRDAVAERRRFLLIPEKELRGSNEDVEQRLEQLYAIVTANPSVVPVIDQLDLLLEGGAGDRFEELFGGIFLSGGHSFILVCESNLARKMRSLRRITCRTLPILDKAPVMDIIQQALPELATRRGLKISGGAVKSISQEIWDLSRDYYQSRNQPEIGLTLAENLVDRAFDRSLDQPEASEDEILIQDLRQEVSRELGLDENSLRENAADFYDQLECRLQEVIIGQDHALKAICQQLKNKAKEPTGRFPKGRFLLVGPSGIGKTETARRLAEFLGMGAEAFYKFNMGEYATESGRTRFIGSDPGYVDSGQTNTIFNAVQERSACVILLDEVDRAHPSVQDILLGILEGEGKDYRGQPVYFPHVIFIMTTNYGGKLVADYYRQLRRGENQSRKKVAETFTAAHLKSLLAKGVSSELDSQMLTFIQDQLDNLSGSFNPQGKSGKDQALAQVYEYMNLRDLANQLESHQRRTTLDSALLDRADAVIPYFPLLREDQAERFSSVRLILQNKGLDSPSDETQISPELKSIIKKIVKELPDECSIRAAKAYITQNWRNWFSA